MLARPLTRAVLLSGVVVALGSGVAFALAGSGSVVQGTAGPLKARPAAPTRYSVVGSCQSIRVRPGGQPLGGAAGPFRMQAAALGV